MSAVAPGLMRVVATVAIALAAMGSIACQGDESSRSAPTGEASPETQARDGGSSASPAQDGQDERGGGEQEGEVSFVGAKGTGDGALRDFGTEPSPADRSAIVAAVRTYTAAAADADGDRACGVMSRALWKDAAAGGTREGCAGTYSTLFADYTSEARAKLAEARPAFVRIKGNHAIARYTMPGPNWNTLPLKRVGGEWKVDRYGEWSAAR